MSVVTVPFTAFLIESHISDPLLIGSDSLTEISTNNQHAYITQVTAWLRVVQSAWRPQPFIKKVKSESLEAAEIILEIFQFFYVLLNLQKVFKSFSTLAALSKQWSRLVKLQQELTTN